MRISDWSSDVCSSDLLGNRKAVVDFHQTDLPARIRYPGFLIGLRRSDPRCMQITSVPASALEFPSVRNGELEGFHGNDVCLSESFRQLGRGDRKSTRLNSSH